MRLVIRRLAMIALPVLVLLLPESAGAFPLTNCTLELTSVDGDGAGIDTATAGGADSTQAHPFQVDWDGTVEWSGTMGSQVIKDHHWSVSLFNIPTPLSGGAANEDGETTGDGSVDVGINLPLKITGLFYVSGQISGTGGSCAGSGWMRLVGDPFGTIGFWVGAVLVLLGLLGLWRGLRGSTILAILGGILFGLGAAVMLIIYAQMFVGQWTPLAALVVGLMIGIVVAVLRPDAVTAEG